MRKQKSFQQPAEKIGKSSINIRPSGDLNSLRESLRPSNYSGNEINLAIKIEGAGGHYHTQLKP